MSNRSDDMSLMSAKCNKALAAQLLGLERQQISKLIANGRLSVDADGRFLLRNLIHQYLAVLRDDRRLGHTEADATLKQIKIEERQLALAEKRRDLLSRVAVKNFMIENVGALLAAIAAIPARFTRDLSERRRLEGMINEARNNFAQAMRGEAAKL